jgi:hypothetical protein
MDLPRRGLSFHRITYHVSVTQCLGGLNPPQPWYIVVAPPSGSVADYPQQQQLTAFKVPHGVAVKFKQGTWHAGVCVCVGGGGSQAGCGVAVLWAVRSCCATADTMQWPVLGCAAQLPAACPLLCCLAALPLSLLLLRVCVQAPCLTAPTTCPSTTWSCQTPTWWTTTHTTTQQATA